MRGSKSFIALAAALALAACGGGSALQTFDLSAASLLTTDAPTHKLRAQVLIREPTTSLDLDSQRILVRTGPEAVAYLSGAQWSDRMPVLVQSRLLQTFQNAHLLQSVGRAGAGAAADYNLELDIRAFELDVPSMQAKIEITAKIVSATNGRIVAAQIFKAAVPATGTGGPEAAAALNSALAQVMMQIVAFTSGKV